MADYDPKNSMMYNVLIGALGSNDIPKPLPPNNKNSLLASLLSAAPQPQPLFGSLLTTPPNSLANIVAPSPSPLGYGSLAPLFSNLPLERPTPLYASPTVKRKTYFSFHYDDVHRTVVVRKSPLLQKVGRSFTDSSLWEKTKVTDPERLKRIITAAMKGSSSVCILTGSDTYGRPWVRYEIARAVVDRRGLVTVHINNMKAHHPSKERYELGPNPLAYMGISKKQNGAYYLCEKNWIYDRATGASRWAWQWYEDYVLPVALPRWVTARPGVEEVITLADEAEEFCYQLDDGFNNLSSWLDAAARRAGYANKSPTN